MYDKRPSTGSGRTGDPGASRDSVTPGKRSLVEGLPRREAMTSAPGAPSPATPGQGAGTRPRATASLPSDLRALFERSLGADLGNIRVHTGAEADAAARSAGALAFAKGSDIYFAEGHYDPTSSEGRLLLAHEVAHTVQQQPRTAPAAVRSGDGLEHEADDAAGRMLRGLPAQVSAAASGTSVQYKKVQLGSGYFTDESHHGYAADNEEDRSKPTCKRSGAKMELVFQPDPGLDADVVSLVQTTRSTITNHSSDVPDQPRALLDERRTDEGVSIDQEIYPKDPGTAWDPPLVTAVNDLWSRYQLLEHKLQGDVNQLGTDHKTIHDRLQNMTEYLTRPPNGKKPGFGGKNTWWVEMKNCAQILAKKTAYRWLATGASQIIALLEVQTRGSNLDPRYTEQRTTETGALRPAAASTVAGLSGVVGNPGWAARRTGDQWSFAVLRDMPGHTVNKTDRLTGEETFETAAMAEKGGEKHFIGSVRWGWKIKAGTLNEAVLQPAEIEKAADTASRSFYRAAEKWNAMKVPDPKDPERMLATLQLPRSPEPNSDPLPNPWARPTPQLPTTAEGVIAFIGEREGVLRAVLQVLGSPGRMRLRGVLLEGSGPQHGISPGLARLTVSLIEDLERQSMLPCRVEARE
jgi:hypothetical protein